MASLHYILHKILNMFACSPYNCQIVGSSLFLDINQQFGYKDIIHMFLFRSHLLAKTLNLNAFNRYCFGVIKFNLPDLGEKIKEGTIKKIYVKEGDAVEEFQKLADVASDKQFTEITASNSGVIQKIYYQEEEVCQVGDLFLEIFVKEEGGSSAAESPIAPQQKQQQPNQAHQSAKVEQSKATSGVLATPYVRGLIKSHGLDISKIKGTGEAGRILEKDVEQAIKKPQVEQTQKAEVKQAVKTEVTSTLSNLATVTMNGYEKGMQKSMTESNTIPHLYLHEELDITEVQRMRKSLKENNKKVTVMGILIKTFSLALKQFPKMNSLYHPQVNPFQYSIHPNHNISIAIDSPNGLVVPHIKNVNNISLLEIQNELERLRNLAKDAKLTAKELQGGTICLSNIGTIGGTHACPLILPPQICIVAIGKLQSVPKYRGGELVERKVLNVSFGCDHRVVDGATVARFSNCWKQLIQNPYLSIAEMI